MANNITRILPFGDVNGHNVINHFSFDGVSGEAGTVVKVQTADLGAGPVSLYARGDAWASYSHTVSLYPYNPNRVTTATGTGDAGLLLGLLMKDVREVDENGEKLLFNSKKKELMNCAISGETVPVLTRGLIMLNKRAFLGGVVPPINSVAVVAAGGQLTGMSYTFAATGAGVSNAYLNASVGRFIATGFRTGLFEADDLAGPYALLKVEL